MYVQSFRVLQLQFFFLRHRQFRRRRRKFAVPNFFPLLACTTVLISVCIPLSGTPHCCAAARTSINRALAPDSRSVSKKLLTECDPSVS